MSVKAHDGREHQLVSLERRLRELEELSAMAAHGIIMSAARERRSLRGEQLDREVARLRAERKRLEREAELTETSVSEAEADHHLSAIERQIREVIAERDGWFRGSLEGQRRRRDDFRLMQRLKEENERLTAELMRCASMLAHDRTAADSPRLRRVWQMLRLSGT
jgi:hypothetical protein